VNDALEWIGFFLSAIDFYGVAGVCEGACIRFRDWLEGLTGAIDERIEGKSGRFEWTRRFLYQGLVGVGWGALLIFGSSILQGQAFGVYVFVVTLIAVILFFGQMVLNLVILGLHLLAMPKKGIIGTAGFVLAFIGLLI
jgi:hypothetical protein